MIQAGTVAYLGIMEATMAHNGGKHAWDITAAEAQNAAYVHHSHPLQSNCCMR
jgi:hypothetical protein